VPVTRAVGMSHRSRPCQAQQRTCVGGDASPAQRSDRSELQHVGRWLPPRPIWSPSPICSGASVIRFAWA